MAKQKPKCPQCGSTEVVPIVVGYPSLEMFESAERGEVALGGCCVEIDDPEWHCKDCERRW